VKQAIADLSGAIFYRPAFVLYWFNRPTRRPVKLIWWGKNGEIPSLSRNCNWMKILSQATHQGTSDTIFAE
jgi:hypothetical protein